jgi:hypothetical protein
MRALDGSLLGEMIFFQEKGRRLYNHADATGVIMYLLLKKRDLGWQSSKSGPMLAPTHQEVRE